MQEPQGNQSPIDFNNQQAADNTQSTGAQAAASGDTSAAASAAVSVALTTSVPSVATSATIDWGSWAEQLLQNETPVIESVVEGGISMALSAVPFGNIIANFIGPTVVKQYVDQGIAVLGAALANKSIAISDPTTLEAYVVNMIKNEAPILSAFIGGALPGIVQKAIGAAGVK